MSLPYRMGLTFLATVMPCFADVEADKSKKPPVEDAAEALDAGQVPAAATIERIMEQAARNITARYNLNDVQTEETRKLMKREVYRFLKAHENEVWPAIRDLLAAELGAKPPDSREEKMRLGKAARPLVKLAEEAIFGANEEWRLILTQEQKSVHDFDLSEMRKTFKKIDENFGEWEKGRSTENGIFPGPKLTGRQPRRPSQPPKGRLPEPEVEIFNPHRIFETLVEEFIKEYELDEGQITSARSILEEFKGKANDVREARKLQFAKIAVQQQEALTRRDLDAIKEAAAAHKKLLEPVYQLCSAMGDRLKALLTTAQIQRHVATNTVTKAPEKSSTLTKKPPKKKTTVSESKSKEGDSKTKNDSG